MKVKRKKYFRGTILNSSYCPQLVAFLPERRYPRLRHEMVTVRFVVKMNILIP